MIKRNSSKRLSLALLAGLMTLAFTSVGASAFVTYSYEKAQVGSLSPCSEQEAVCQITNSAGTFNYPSLSIAMYEASKGTYASYANTISTIPSKTNYDNPTYLIANSYLADKSGITYGYTLKAGDTLNLQITLQTQNGAYTDNTDSGPGITQMAASKGGYGHAYTKTANCQTRVVLEDNVYLYNYGTINIGAQQNTGTAGSPINSNAYGRYAEMYLSSGARLLNKSSSVLNCYGYVRGETNSSGTPLSYVISESGSKVLQMLSIVEHRGGSIFVGMAGKGSADIQSIVEDGLTYSTDSDHGPDYTGIANLTCFPFNRFFFAGFLDVNYEFQYGSSLGGLGALYANSENLSMEFSIIGTSSALFNLSSGSKIKGYIESDSLLNHLDTYGSWSLGNFAFEFTQYASKTVLITVHAWVRISLSTAAVLLPVSHYYDVALHRYESGAAATVDASAQGVKLLPGSELFIDQGVTVKAKEIASYPAVGVFYDENGETDLGAVPTANYIYPKTVSGVDLSDANFIVNGTLDSGRVGGEVKTTRAGATLSIAEDGGYLTTSEVSNTAGTGTISVETIMSVTMDQSYTMVGYKDCVLDAVGDIVLPSGKNIDNAPLGGAGGSSSFTSNGSRWSWSGSSSSTTVSVSVEEYQSFGSQIGFSIENSSGDVLVSNSSLNSDGTGNISLDSVYEVITIDGISNIVSIAVGNHTYGMNDFAEGTLTVGISGSTSIVITPKMVVSTITVSRTNDGNDTYCTGAYTLKIFDTSGTQVYTASATLSKGKSSTWNSASNPALPEILVGYSMTLSNDDNAHDYLKLWKRYPIFENVTFGGVAQSNIKYQSSSEKADITSAMVSNGGLTISFKGTYE